MKTLSGLGPNGWSVDQETVNSTTVSNSISISTSVYGVDFQYTGSVTLQTSDRHSVNMSRPSSDPYEYKLELFQMHVTVSSVINEYANPGGGLMGIVYSSTPKNNLPTPSFHVRLSSKCP